MVYSMKGRTYRYYDGPVQYPFGFGLSYTSFSYNWQQQPEKSYRPGDTLACSVTLDNTGDYDGDEVVQAYIVYPDMQRMPLKELKAVGRVKIPRHGQTPFSFAIPLQQLQKWDLTSHNWKLYPGKYKLILGSDSRDAKITADFTILPFGNGHIASPARLHR